ncbi:hypothetical protein Taro_046803 [Colocasia esculenta]|uniref:Uncharacterized protein n=1 Tax=Colocasia esculenta TaxID=4460 RepID=A0A843WZU8_COLES|nr:hypothetical protein [Colocasia esculenta]
MGGKKRSPSKSIFAIIKRLFRRPRHVHDAEEEEQPRHGEGRHTASDDDQGHWHCVGEPDIDIKATNFIAKFHETRLSDPKTVAV